MTYWAKTTLERNFKTTSFTKLGKQVAVSVNNFYAIVEPVVTTDELSLEELATIIINYNLYDLQLTPFPEETINISTTTTTTLPEYELEETNINSSTYTKVLTVQDYDRTNYFTNASSFRKYLRYTRGKRGFYPVKYFGETLYLQAENSFFLNFEDMYTAVLLEFQIDTSNLGQFTNLLIKSSYKQIGNILLNKYNNNILIKAVSPLSSYLYAEKNSQQYSSSSEMTGILLSLENKPEEKIKIKYFIFNSVFENVEVSVVKTEQEYKKIAYTPNYQNEIFTTTTTSTTTTTTTAFLFDTSKFSKNNIFVNTIPVHFTVSVYN